jgi:hypothetical protein
VSLESRTYQKAIEAGVSGGLTLEEAGENKLRPDYQPSYIGTDSPEEFLEEILRETDHAQERDEKKDELFVRSLYSFSDELEQEYIDSAVDDWVEDDNDLAIVLAQYIDDIEQATEDERVLEEVYDAVSNYDDSRALAAAKKPVEDLPDSIEDRNYDEIPGIELSDAEVVPRLRNMVGAGECELMDICHYDTLMLGDEDEIRAEDAKNTTLIRMDDELVGAFKNSSERSMVGLQNVKKDGKLAIQRGRGYRLSYNVIEQEKSSVKKVEGWDILDLDRLELRPLRELGDHEETENSPEEMKQLIDQRVAEMDF